MERLRAASKDMTVAVSSVTSDVTKRLKSRRSGRYLYPRHCRRPSAIIRGLLEETLSGTPCGDLPV